jgi:hypothetical protein
MESDVKREEAWLEQIQKAVDLLVVKLEAHESVQHQMAAQMALTSQALAQSTKEHVALTQQVVATSDQVTCLIADRHWEDTREGGASRDHNHNGPQQGGLTQHANCSTFGRNHQEEEVQVHQSALPKLSFPKFYGENQHIWLDKCVDYFRIFNIPETMWTMAASLHMEDNAAKWLQVYKLKKDLTSWSDFASAVEEKFGVYDYRSSIQDLLQVKQEGTVEEYTKAFLAIQLSGGNV